MSPSSFHVPRALRRASLLVALAAALSSASGCDRPVPAPATQPTPPAAETTAAQSAPEAASADPAAPAAAATPSTRTDYGPLSAVFELPWGSFRVTLATKECPRNCASFVNLVERGYYNDQIWGDFSPVVKQTGETSGRFNAGYSLPREFSRRLLFDRGGLLCASNTSDDPDARVRPGRIFVTVKSQERWNLVYCVFGEVTDGMDVVRRMTEGDRIVRVRIEGDLAPMKAMYAKELAEWNAKLDAALPRRPDGKK